MKGGRRATEGDGEGDSVIDMSCTNIITIYYRMLFISLPCVNLVKACMRFEDRGYSLHRNTGSARDLYKLRIASILIPKAES